MSTRALISPIAIAVLFLVGVPTMSVAAPDLSSVKELYAAAAYAEALEVLGGVEGADNTEAVEQYRALCLLALGRTTDAEQALERLVIHRPLYVLPAAEVSPRLVTMYRDVRRRALPNATRQTYTRAKTSYDAKDHKTAAAQFKDVLALINDPDAAGKDGALAELKQLAEGFLTLSEAALAPAAAPPPPPQLRPVSEQVKAASAPRVYTTVDADVVAPLPINRRMPSWKPSNLLVAQRSFRGVLEVIVNEEGLVEWAGMSKPSFPTYDADLLAETRNWRFKPAMKNREPVKYRLAVEVVLLASRDE